MDNFEKVEKLRERANVSYEEAKEALEASNWDLLDAMIYLEKKGRTASAGTYSTAYETKGGNGMDQGYTKEYNYTGSKETFGDKVRALLKKSDENHFRVNRKDGSKLVEMPIWLMIVLLLAFWSIALILFIVGLFCGVSYSFVGPDRMDAANRVMETCENCADSIRDAVTGNNDQPKKGI